MTYSRSMVHWALYSSPGQQFTVTEIQKKIFSEKSAILSRKTVLRALSDLSIFCSDIFSKESNRIGAKKIPVNQYSITLKK